MEGHFAHSLSKVQAPLGQMSSPELKHIIVPSLLASAQMPVRYVRRAFSVTGSKV